MSLIGRLSTNEPDQKQDFKGVDTGSLSQEMKIAILKRGPFQEQDAEITRDFIIQWEHICPNDL